MGHLTSELTSILTGAREIYVSGCAAEIGDLSELLRDQGASDCTITGLFSPLVNHGSCADADRGIRVRTFLLTKALKAGLVDGHVDYCPWRYSMINRWLAAEGRFDAALVMVSPPDRNGLCSLGVQADFLPAFHGRVGRLIAIVNPNMPHAGGDALIDHRAFAATIDYDRPLAEMRDKPADEISDRIARTIVGLVPDGATIQLGTGQIPSRVLANLTAHKGLKIHTGVIDDNILALEASGAIDRSVPIRTGTAVGTAALYAELADRQRFEMKSVAYTHAYANIAATRGFNAINSVLQIDLLGQASAEAIGGRIAASPGGLPDFVRGAQDSDGGQSIIAVRALPAGKSEGIVPLLGDPGVVSCGAVEGHIFVSEFGVADVRGLSIDRRAEAIISIAAPQRRAALLDAWKAMRGELFGRGLGLASLSAEQARVA